MVGRAVENCPGERLGGGERKRKRKKKKWREYTVRMTC